MCDLNTTLKLLDFVKKYLSSLVSVERDLLTLSKVRINQSFKTKYITARCRSKPYITCLENEKQRLVKQYKPDKGGKYLRLSGSRSNFGAFEW